MKKTEQEIKKILNKVSPNNSLEVACINCRYWQVLENNQEPECNIDDSPYYCHATGAYFKCNYFKTKEK